MRNGIFILLLSCCVLAAGCAGVTPAPSAGAAATDSALNNADQFIQHGFAFKMGHTRARIIKNLGNPLDIHVERAKEPDPFITNPADDIKDETIELLYDGISIVLFRAAAEDQELLQQVSITNGKYTLKWDLNVGAARSAVTAALGKPSDERADAAVYRNSQGEESFVTFSFKNDIVTKIDWWFDLE